MDKPRPSQARKKKLRRVLLGLFVMVAGGLVTLGLYRLEPAAPRVDAAALYPGTVERGEMVREVRGLGRLVPEDIRLIVSETSGRVESVRVQAGVTVTADTLLAVLSSPELEQQTRDAAYDITAADAEHENLVLRLEDERITQEQAIRTAELDYEEAKAEFDDEEFLFQEGLSAERTLNSARVALVKADSRLEGERRKLESSIRSHQGQIAASEAKLNQLRGAYELKVAEVAALEVRAGVAGVLQEIPLELGQNLSAGGTVGRVANPSRLKAELDISESQVGDVEFGQEVVIDLRPEKVLGTVVRIDPTVSGGVVKVDVRFEEPLPANSRPDQSVDGLIEIERLEDVLYLSPRPSIGQAQSTVGLFVLQANGEAVRRPVRLGRTSANAIEVLEGLLEGDEVVLSDMSQWDEFDRIRLD